MAIVKLTHSRVYKDGEGRLSVGIDVPFGPAGKPEVVYKFRPADPKDPVNDQMCEVTNPDHLAVFLSLPEGYDVAFSKDEKVDRKKLSDQAQALVLKRETDAQKLQLRYNAAADRRQRKAKEMKGKKAPMMEIASLDEA